MKHEVPRQLFVAAPDHAAHARMDEAVLVAGGIDRLDERELEIPGEVGVQEGRNEGATCSVDAEWNLQALLRIDAHERIVNFFDGLELARVRCAENRHCSDRVLVYRVGYLPGRDDVTPVLHGQGSRLDVPVPAEFLPHDLYIGPHDQVR
jgi:hypothetical protein